MNQVRTKWHQFKQAILDRAHQHKVALGFQKMNAFKSKCKSIIKVR